MNTTHTQIHTFLILIFVKEIFSYLTDNLINTVAYDPVESVMI